MLSTGMIAFLCAIVITTIILIILYCICRSTDPLLDHTCRAWLFHPRTINKGKHRYDTIPLNESQNGLKAPRKDKLEPVEKFRVQEKIENPKARGVDVIRSTFYQGNPEKCPLSLSEQDFNRNESFNKENRKIAPREEKGRHHRSRSREYWEPKAKSVHDIYITEQNPSYLSKAYNTDKRRAYPSRSLDFIEKIDEQDGGDNPSLYQNPRPLKRKDISDHYVYPRSLERDVKDERNKRERLESSMHYVRPRSVDRDVKDERDRNRERHSSNYVRPRSLERDVMNERDRKRERHQSSSHYVRPRSLEIDMKDERERKRERPYSNYVRPRSREKEKSSHSSFHNVTDSDYVYSRLVAQSETRHRNETNKQDKHVSRSKDYLHSKENVYQNITTSKEKAPLLQTFEEITVSQVPQLSSKINRGKEMEPRRNRDQHHKPHAIEEGRDGANVLKQRDERDKSGPQKRDGRERQSRPRSRSATEYRKRSLPELNDGWHDHKKRDKESYFLPRTQSEKSERPPKNASSSLARRHTIHLEYHPRSGDVTPMDQSAIKPEYWSREKREFSPKRNVTKKDGESGKRPHVYETNQDYLTRRQWKNVYSERNPEQIRVETRRTSSDENKQFQIRMADELKDREPNLRPRPVDRETETSESSGASRRFTIPPRYDSLADGYKDAELNPRGPVTGKKSNEDKPKYLYSSDGHKSLSQKTLTVSKDIKGQYLDENKDYRVRDKNRKTNSESMEANSRISEKQNKRDELLKEPERRNDHWTDGKKLTDKDTERGPKKREHGNNRFTPKEFVLENYPNVQCSGTTMENIHREIQSSSIYKTTDDGRLVLRDENQEEREQLIQEQSQDKETQGTVSSKRKKSMERLFYIKSVPKSEPTIDLKESAEVSQEKNSGWQLLNVDGQAPKQDTHPAGGDEKTKGKNNNLIPTKVLRDKNIDWHLFTLTGEKVDTNKDGKTSTVNSYSDEGDGRRAANHQSRSGKERDSKETIYNNIDKVTPMDDRKMKQDERKPSTTDSIKYSIQTQIKYGEELRNKPTILTFE